MLQILDLDCSWSNYPWSRFLNCKDWLFENVNNFLFVETIEALDQEHVETNWNPQAYLAIIPSFISFPPASMFFFTGEDAFLLWRGKFTTFYNQFLGNGENFCLVHILLFLCRVCCNQQTSCLFCLTLSKKKALGIYATFLVVPKQIM